MSKSKKWGEWIEWNVDTDVCPIPNGTEQGISVFDGDEGDLYDKLLESLKTKA